MSSHIERSPRFLTSSYSGEELVHHHDGRLQSLFMYIEPRDITPTSDKHTTTRTIVVDNHVYQVGFYIDQEEMPGYHLTPNLSPYFTPNSYPCTWDQYGLMQQCFPCCQVRIDTYVDYYLQQEHIESVVNVIRTMIEMNGKIYRFPTIFPFGCCTRLEECRDTLIEGFINYENMVSQIEDEDDF